MFSKIVPRMQLQSIFQKLIQLQQIFGLHCKCMIGCFCCIMTNVMEVIFLKRLAVVLSIRDFYSPQFLVLQASAYKCFRYTSFFYENHNFANYIDVYLHNLLYQDPFLLERCRPTHQGMHQEFGSVGAVCSIKESSGSKNQWVRIVLKTS